MKTVTACCLLFLLLAAPGWAAPLVVTLTAPQTGRDPLKSYIGLILTLALDKTRAEYGDYQINTTPMMNSARALADIKEQRFPNQLLMSTFQNRLLDEGLDYARFSVDYGVTGYRICFVSPMAKDAVAKVKTLDDLRQFSIGQGIGWADAEILRNNGFNVVDIGQQESAYRMVEASRFDLFCRGINELEPELLAHPELPKLDYDRAVALSYPLPRVFIASKHNAKLLKRIALGLMRAQQDGSLRKAWLEQYGSALRFANLKQRRIFQLENPNISRIDFDFRKFYFDPRK